MNKVYVLGVLALFACEKAPKSEPKAATPAAATSASPSAPTPLAQAPATPASKIANFTGTFQSTQRKSTTGKKEGAPSGWDKDDGSRFTGAGTLQLTVAQDGTVTGALKGALGEQLLHGRLDGDELRASLVPAGTDVSLIQNGFLSLKREGDTWKGILTCASGDALLLREAQVELKQSAG